MVERILGPELKNQTVELPEMIEPICWLYGCLTLLKNQHHSSIQFWHIADSVLGIIFVMPRCTWLHPYQWTESDVALWWTMDMAPWCSGYHYCTTSFNQAWTQVLRRFKPCWQRVGDSRWWGSLTMVPAGNKAKRLSSVNHSAKTIDHHHQSNK